MRNSITEDMDEFGKVGAGMSYLQSQMHFDYDSAESIADKMELDVNFISASESTGETCCIVFTRKRRTTKPIQEFCFQKR